MTVEIIKIQGDTVEFVQDGQHHSWRGSTAAGRPGDLRTTAAAMKERAVDLHRRAEVMLAVANAKELQEIVAKEAAKTQRAERAAATRAHHADPFGFEAAARNNA